MKHIIQAPLFEHDKPYYLNVYAALDGTIRPTPFEMPKEGMWRFDGQFFYLPKEQR